MERFVSNLLATLSLWQLLKDIWPSRLFFFSSTSFMTWCLDVTRKWRDLRRSEELFPLETNNTDFYLSDKLSDVSTTWYSFLGARFVLGSKIRHWRHSDGSGVTRIFVVVSKIHILYEVNMYFSTSCVCFYFWFHLV